LICLRLNRLGKTRTQRRFKLCVQPDFQGSMRRARDPKKPNLAAGLKAILTAVRHALHFERRRNRPRKLRIN